jgi:nitroreductase
VLEKLVIKNRSYRRFYQQEPVPSKLLHQLINLARFSPSAANLQPLKFILSNQPKTNNLIFNTLSWAGYLRNWTGPQPGEQPSAYIIILGDSTIKKNINCDHGIAAQSILLGAVEHGLGGCIIASINRDDLIRDLNISERFTILLVIALGKPKEEVRVEDIGPDGSIEYWRDTQNTHHVPKRSLADLILREL